MAVARWSGLARAALTARPGRCAGCGRGTRENEPATGRPVDQLLYRSHRDRHRPGPRAAAARRREHRPPRGQVAYLAELTGRLAPAEFGALAATLQRGPRGSAGASCGRRRLAGTGVW